MLIICILKILLHISNNVYLHLTNIENVLSQIYSYMLELETAIFGEITHKEILVVDR
jgi:hypothetical protein